MNLLVDIDIPSRVKDFNGPRGIAFMEIMSRRPEGRPSSLTQAVLSKLEQAFLHAMTDERACTYAGISPAALYRYEGQNPEFREQKKAWKLHPDILAQQELVQGIKGNVAQARW